MHGPMPHGAMMFSPFMHALHQLNLTAEQKQSIESIMAAQRDQAKAAMKSAHDNMDALANPGDPSYAAAIAAAKTQAAAEIQKRSDIEVQIYSLLSNEQKTQLPKVIADMKAKHEAHRATHQHGPASTGN
jgi:Spy/CpxP family protein refolding chaperone